jgi:iron complex outermembrane receptor protein
VFKYKISPQLNAEAGIRYDYNYYDVTKWYNKSDWEDYYAATFSAVLCEKDANRVLTRPKLTMRTGLTTQVWNIILQPVLI